MTVFTVLATRDHKPPVALASFTSHSLAERFAKLLGCPLKRATLCFLHGLVSGRNGDNPLFDTAMSDLDIIYARHNVPAERRLRSASGLQIQHTDVMERII